MVKQALVKGFPMQHRPWLNRLEYLTIAASVAGVITTAMTQQVLWAVTPLLFTLGLNNAQRRQLQARYTQLTQQVETLETTPPDPALAVLESHNLDHLAAQIATLEQSLVEQTELETTLAELRSQLAPLPELTATTQHLSDQWQELESQNLRQAFEQLQDSVQGLQELLQLIPQTNPEAQPEWQAPIQTLEDRLTQWQQTIEAQWQAVQAALPDEAQATQTFMLQNLQVQVQKLIEQQQSLAANSSVQPVPEQSSDVTAVPPATLDINPELAFLTEPNAEPVELPMRSPESLSQSAIPTHEQPKPESEQIATPETNTESSTSEPTPPNSSTPNNPTGASATPFPDESSVPPPAVPPQYRREHLGAAPPENSVNPAPDIDPATESTQSETIPPSAPEPTDSTSTEPERLDLEDVLPPELEAGVKELGENLWAMGKSLRQTWDRLAQGLGTEVVESDGWQLVQTYALIDFVPQAIAFQGQYVAYGTTQGTVQVADWQQQTLEAQIAPDSAGVTAIAFSPDAQSLLVGQTNGRGSLWYWSSGELRHTFSGHPLPVTTVAVSPHGRTCATGSADKTIALWDVGTGQLLRSLTGHWDRVTSLTFSPDGKSLVTGSHDGTIKRWDIQSGQKVANAAPGGQVCAVAMSADGQWVVSGGERQAHCWASNTLAQRNQYRLLRKLTGVATATQQPLWGAIAGSSLQIWDATTNQKLATLNTGQPGIALEWLPQDQELLCVTEAGEVQRWRQVISAEAVA
ncbi:MAG: hypothetical protein F6J87_18565 [Spirulina sp. SIO3F2]|nr:hypothetical protein [Spirulina sp. SIO3F2]